MGCLLPPYTFTGGLPWARPCHRGDSGQEAEKRVVPHINQMMINKRASQGRGDREAVTGHSGREAPRSVWKEE